MAGSADSPVRIADLPRLRAILRAARVRRRRALAAVAAGVRGSRGLERRRDGRWAAHARCHGRRSRQHRLRRAPLSQRRRQTGRVGRARRGTLRGADASDRDGSLLSAHQDGHDVSQPAARQAGRSQAARIPALRAEPPGPTGRAAVRPRLPAHPGAVGGRPARKVAMNMRGRLQMRFRSMAPIPPAGLAATLLTLSLLLAAAPAAAQADKVAQGLALQAARARFVVRKAKKVFYTTRWDLSGLPSYRPAQQVSGTIEMWGSNYIEDSDL